MVFQLYDVNQYLTGRPDDGFFLFLITLNCGRGGRMRFQKLIHCRPQSGTADDAAVLGVGETFDRFHLRNVLFRPHDPNLLRALLLIKLKPAFLRNLNLLILVKCGDALLAVSEGKSTLNVGI